MEELEAIILEKDNTCSWRKITFEEMIEESFENLRTKNLLANARHKDLDIW